MKKLISAFCLIFLGVILLLTTGCTSRDVALEVARSLVQMNKTGIENIDSEIIQIDRQVYNNKLNLVKLEQVLQPALKWVDYQKESCKPGKWDVQVTSSGLSQFQNDQYQVVVLQVVCSRDYATGTQCTNTIKILDLATKQTVDSYALRDNLTNTINLLENKRTTMVKARDLSTITINNSLKYINDWKIQDAGNMTYRISGPGLGWSEKLTTGIWDYNREKGTLLPGDKQAENMNNIMLGK